ncbi:MAG: prepilin-type N-terminal cleavage/methylation domain-containing protein [Firmicutes bacterium]|nr:prepilin-type N-terminal cleavage/methylation domain-containing protein [Bacillota bacterium]
MVRNKTSGFTLIELMIAMIVAGIGILAVSWVLLLNQRSWKEGNAKLELQRDTYLAMLTIEYELRPASFADVTTSDSTLIIDKNIDKKFFLQSGDLRFQKSSSDDSTLVVKGDPGSAFDADISNDVDVVNINFTLVRGNLQSSVTTSVKPRN